MKKEIAKLLVLVKEYNATLISVSKRIELDKVVESVEYGATHLGESRVQELQEKVETFRSLDCTIHFIGHLQSNKVKKAVEMSDCIHTIDSLKKAKLADKYSAEFSKKTKVFIQVNISNDTDKFGFSKEEFLKNFSYIYALPNIEVIGLMTIGLRTDDQDAVRAYYRELKQLMTYTQENFTTNESFKEISMGMSNDYKIALEEGSTFIRVGTGIYGQRSY